MARRYRNIIGPKVRELRTQLGLTQDQLAARLQLAGLENMDRVAVAKIETHIRSVYDFEAIVLANVLRVDVNQLMSIPHRSLKTSLPKLMVGSEI